MDGRRPVLSLAVAAALLLPASEALAYCRRTTCDADVEECRRNAEGCVREGAALRWAEMPLTYRFDAAGSAKLPRQETRAAIRAAFQRWSDVMCDGRPTSLRFVEGPDITRSKPLVKDSRGKEAFGIYFRDEAWPYEGTEALAKTNLDFGLLTGTIAYADIEINAAQQKLALSDAEDGVDLQYVMTHEVGHWIGLAHSVGPADDSIMAPQYCSESRCGSGKFVARRLAAQDVAAVCAAYPPDGTRLFDDSLPPPRACAVSPATRSGSAVVPLVVLGLAALARWRRARR